MKPSHRLFPYAGKLSFILFAFALVSALLMPSCRREEEGPSAIEVGMPGVAVENNTKLLIALPLDNTSKREARNVTLTEVRLKDGTRELPATLPVNVGDIAPDGRKVVQTRFNVPGLDPSKKYELEVEGHYRSQEDREHRFQYRAELTIPPIGPG